MPKSRNTKQVKPKLFDNDASTAELESIVFGRQAAKADGHTVDAVADDPVVDDSGIANPAAAATMPKKRRKSDTDAPLKSPGGAAEDVDALAGFDAPADKSAWIDPDDAALQVDLNHITRTRKLKRSHQETKVTGDVYESRLRERFQAIHGNVRWAEEGAAADADTDSDESDEEGLGSQVPTSARTTGVAGRPSTGGGRLLPTNIAIKRLKEVPITAGGGKGPAVISSVQFHPNSELLLVGSMDKKLRIYAADGEDNAKVSSYFFKKFPIRDASFTPDGSQVLMTCSSGGDTMYCLDVESGQPSVIKHLTSQVHKGYRGLVVGPNPTDSPGLRSSQMYSVLGDAGTVLVCDVRSKQPVRTLRMRTQGASAAFMPGADNMFSADSECNIYKWDLGSGKCMERMADPWASSVKSLAVCSLPTPFLAVGTGTGNVDLFDISAPQFPREPTKAIDNLTTSISTLKFHPKGELLVAASPLKQRELRLIHAGTGTVFQNWPKIKTPLHRVSAVDFSRNGGLLAIGNEQGRVLLFQLPHYEKSS